MQIYLWKNFSKRVNSTKRPNDNEKEIRDVRLKENCSLESPTFILSGNIDISYNYLAWNFTYYYISDLVYLSNDLYEIYTVRDELATYKDVIGNYTTFIERSNSNFDSYINDSYLSSRQSIKAFNRTETDTGFIDFGGVGGTIIVRTTSANSTSKTGFTMYAIPPTQLYKLTTYIFGDSILSDVADIAVKTLFNPFDYIIDVKWLPLNIDVVAPDTTPHPIKLGRWTTDDSFARIITSYGVVYTKTLVRPDSYFGDFRDNNPEYTQYKLYIPSVGLIDVDPLDVSQGIDIAFSIDFLTGSSYVDLMRRGTTNSFANFNGTISAPVDLSQVKFDGNRIVSDIIGSASNLGAGNYTASIMEGVDVVKALFQPTVSIQGNAGNMTQLRLTHNYLLYRTTYDTADFPLSTVGRPCYKNLRIGTLSGFIKCGNASLDISGHPADKETVNSYLNSGFYYE